MSSGPVPTKDDLAARLQIANRLPRLAFLSTLAVLGTLGGVVVWPAVNHGGREFASPGPVSNHHRLIAGQCESCHAKPFEGAADVQCAACHRVTGHSAAMPRMLAAHPEREMKCASCHKEHHGLRTLVPTDSPLCTGCHSQIGKLLADTVEPAVGSLARHPESPSLTRLFTAAGPGEEIPAPRDPTSLKFSHAEHLQPHPGKAHPEPASCPSCHQLGAEQTTMQPISFVKHCQRCHELTLDGRLEGQVVPHGSPDRALETIQAQLSRAYVDLGLAASDAAPPRAEAGAGSMPTHDEIAAEVLDLEQALYTGHNGCAKCHDVTEGAAEPGKSRHGVVEPKIPKTWMPAARFAHGPHRTTPCRECHVTAERSTSAADVQIPGIARCRECHSDPGASGKVESPCLECHRYHASK